MADLAVFLVLLLLGFTFGRLTEGRHYKRIRSREEELRNLVVVPVGRLPARFADHHSKLVMGNVVVSVDYFKTVTAALRGLVGGKVSAFESLLDRARREAILRMQEEAARIGATAVFNMRLETSRVSGGKRSEVGSVEVLAYGTALTPRSQ